MKRGVKILMAAALLAAGVLGCYIFWQKTSLKKVDTVLGSQDNILVQIEKDVKNIDVQTGKISNAQDFEKNDFEKFSGLPKDKTVFRIELFSLDHEKAIITSQNSDGTINSEFTCDLIGKKCSSSNLLTQKYQGLGADLQYGQNFGWLAWDYDKKLLYANFSQQNIDISPIWKCDTDSRICQKTDGYDSQQKNQIKAIVPQGTLSPTLTKFVMIDQHDELNVVTGKKWDLLLFDSNDLSKTQKAFNINEAIDTSDDIAYDSIQSVVWSGDEKMLFFGTMRKIFSLSLETGELKLLYTASGNDISGLYWDSGTLQITKDGKYLTFVEFVDNPNAQGNENEEDAPEIGVLKKIDLASGTVTEVFRQTGLTLYAQ